MLRRMLAGLFAAAFLAGCATPSVHPIWSKDKQVEEPGLIGAWKGESKDDFPIYHIAKADDGYRMTVKGEQNDKPHQWEFEVRLVQLGEHRFADIAAPRKDRDERNEKWGAFFIPTHMFARYALDGDTLSIGIPSRRFVKQMASEKKLSATRISDDELLITSETDALQAFLKAHAKDAEAFDTTVLKKQKGAPQRGD